MKKTIRALQILFGVLTFFCFLCLGQADDFSIRISGASRYCLFGDLNRGTKGYLDFWTDMTRLDGGIVAEGRKPLHFGWGFTADFVLNPRSSFGVGIGLGNIRAQSQSEIIISYSDGRPDTSAVVETMITAIPIRLSGSKNYSISRAVNAFVLGGIVIYPARFRSNSRPAGTGDSHNQKAHSMGIGLLCGTGLEIKILSPLALVLGAEGNYAKIGSFRGTRKSGGSSIPYEEKGTLYYEETLVFMPPGIENAYPQLMIHKTKPMGDHARPARVDFSGFTISGGIRIFF